jgi:glutamate--cysteine ligase
VSLTEAMLLEDVRQRLFAPSKSATPHAVGLELELIPMVRSTRSRALPALDGEPSTWSILMELGRRSGWAEQRNGDDPSSWRTREGATISFEPGGQIEISTAPFPTAAEAIGEAEGLVALLRDAMGDDGVDLLARGVDPYNDIDAVPLQLHRDRYTGMTRYFESIGSSGVRMMRQTAALQINIERGEDPAARWHLLNSLAPIVVALFANSRDYASRRTEWASYRAHLWRTLDPSRTGIIYDAADPARFYLDFALDAGYMRKASPESGYGPFRDRLHDPELMRDDWLFHLSTLFPEVRPKEFFELRSADTIEIDSLAAPVLFVMGLVYSEEHSRHATEILPPPGVELLERAGRLGVSDPEIRQIATGIAALALDGALALGPGYFRDTDVAAARKYFARALAAGDI